MVDENSLGPMGPNVISVESISDTVYSVEGSNFATGFQVAVQDGVGQVMEGVTVGEPSGTKFRLMLPNEDLGPCTLVVTNPDGRTSAVRFDTPGTSASNDRLRADS